MESQTSPQEPVRLDAGLVGTAGSDSAAAERHGIAVLMTAYQAEAYIAEALESLLAQTDPGWRCIVVDDGSRDGTADIVRDIAARDARIELVQQANAGISAARNVALARLGPADGYVLLLDSDDILLPDALARLRAALDRAPGQVGVQALSDLIDERTERVEPGRWPEFQRQRWHVTGSRYTPLPVGNPTTLDSALHSWRGYPPASVLLRRSAVDASGGFDPDLHASGDWGFFLRVLRSGDLAFLDEVVALYRLHGNNHTRDGQRLRNATRVLKRKAFRELLASPEHRELARRAWRAFEREECLRALATARASVAQRQLLTVLWSLAAWGLHAARWLRGGPGGVAVVSAVLSRSERLSRRPALSRATNPLPEV